MPGYRWIPGFENRYDVSTGGAIRSWVQGSRWGDTRRATPRPLGAGVVKLTRADGREVRMSGDVAARHAFPSGVETWRAVPGFEGRYEVSSLGAVRSLATGSAARSVPRLLTPKPDKDGYRVLGLRRDGRRTFLRVCRLVLSAFVGPQPDGCEASHLDGTKRDHLTNLRWETRPVNNRHRHEHGTMPCKLTAAGVRELRADPAPDFRAYADRYGVRAHAIYAAYHRKTWAHLEP